jgi:hypothetical protein
MGKDDRVLQGEVEIKDGVDNKNPPLASRFHSSIGTGSPGRGFWLCIIPDLAYSLNKRLAVIEEIPVAFA